MLRKYASALAVLLVASLFLTACRSHGTPEEQPFYTFTDAAGYEVTLGQKPEKVAVLFSSFADIWVSAGGTVSVTVGEAVERGFAEKGVLLVDEGAGKAIDTEALIDAEPDLVICSADIPAQTDAAAMLRSAGIPCAAFRVESFDDYLEVLKICTELLGTPDAYVSHGTDVQARIQAILDKLPSSEEPQRILFIRSGSGASSAKAKTAKQHFAAAMLEELGAYNIADNAPVLLDGLSIEEILEEDPDFIFISTMGNEDTARAYMNSVLSEDTWSTLSAVREGRYCYLPKELFQFKPNGAWDAAYRYLAELLYPEIEF